MDVVSCKFEVPQGYSQLLTCGLCNFSCLNEEIAIKICTPSFGDELEISDQNCVEISQNFENLLEKTTEMLQKNKFEK